MPPAGRAITPTYTAKAVSAQLSQQQARNAARGTPAHAPGRAVSNQAVLRRLARDGAGTEPVDTKQAEREIARPGTKLPERLRAEFEASMACDFAGVRIHVGAAPAEAAASVAARAFAAGPHIVFGEGRFAPDTGAGRRLIAHELAHVAQQGAAPAMGPRNPAAGATAPVSRAAPAIARDADDDKIEAIEGKKLDIEHLLAECEGIEAEQRDRMIQKIGGHAGTTHEERQLAALLAVRFRPTMKRADFQNTYRQLLLRLPTDQAVKVLDYVGKEVIGKTSYKVTKDGEETSVQIDKRSINDVGMKGAPGSSIVVSKTVYVVLDTTVQYKTSDAGGPAGRNNNPGNITVDDNAKDAWAPEIGAYPGRSTEGRFAIFPTHKLGRAGAMPWARKRRNSIVKDYFAFYAPDSEKGNVSAHYAEMVVAEVNKQLKTSFDPKKATIDEIDNAGGMEAFVDGQEQSEGFKTSNLENVPKDSPKLPQEVRDFVAGFDKATGGTAPLAHGVAAAAATERKGNAAP